MLLVILGAGASFDSNPRFPPGDRDNIRPPFAADLFSDRFNTATTRFPSCLPIVPYLRPAPGRNVEQTLQALADERGNDPGRVSQILAVQYYLQLMVWSCQNEWLNNGGGLSNYLSLLDQIRRGSGASEPTLTLT